MTQLNTDLEANLVHERHNHAFSQRGEDNRLLIESSEAQLEPAPGDQVVTEFNETSLRFNIVALLIPFGKILTSIFVLLVSDYHCIGVKQIWIVLMMVHDFLHLWIIGMRIQNIKANATLTAQSSYNAVSNINAPHSQGIQLTAMQQAEAQNLVDPEDPRPASQRAETALQASRISERRLKLAKLTTICTYFWVFLFFFWLEKDAISKQTGCDSVGIDNLIASYVLIAWLWLLNPLLVCFAGCLCLPILIIYVLLFRKNAQQSASDREIKKLVVKEYSPELPGNKECAICIADYQEGDKIIQLDCSTMHHFHEACVKDWLKINGQCPICRTRLGEKSSSATNVNSGSSQS